MTRPNERFWQKVKKTDRCWLWTAGHDAAGYGHFWDRGRTVKAHRWMWERENGPIPPKMQVMHICDTPPCIRPTHLQLGTAADNIADKIAKGRGFSGPNPNRRGKATGLANAMHLHPERRPRGEQNGNSRYSTVQIQELKQRWAEGDFATKQEAAVAMGMTWDAVSDVLRGRTWSWL